MFAGLEVLIRPQGQNTDDVPVLVTDRRCPDSRPSEYHGLKFASYDREHILWDGRYILLWDIRDIFSFTVALPDLLYDFVSTLLRLMNDAVMVVSPAYNIRMDDSQSGVSGLKFLSGYQEENDFEVAGRYFDSCMGLDKE